MQSFNRILTLALLGLAPVAPLCGQSASPSARPEKTETASNSKRPEVYHVFFVKAALGKAAELADFLKQPDPNAKNPGHSILLRHQDGDEWDYVAIEHIGPKATVENPVTPLPDSARGMMEKHDDTFVNGPSWEEFAKEMGLNGDASKTAGSVYVVSVYRAAAGHRDLLEKMLSEPPNRAVDTSSGNLLMAHLEGGPWNYLAIVRYDSWEKFATNEKNSVAQSNKKEGGWFELRKHAIFHNDTLTDRIAP